MRIRVLTAALVAFMCAPAWAQTDKKSKEDGWKPPSEVDWGEVSRPKVAVVVVGEEAMPVGTLQMRLEERLSGVEEVILVPGSEIAAKIGRKVDPPDLDWKKNDKVVVLVNQARTDYFEDRLVPALQALESAEKVYAREDEVPPLLRVELSVWRAAIHLGLNELANAETHALTALTISPALKIDTEVFPPSVARVFEEVRAALSFAVVKASTVPPGAWLEVDGRQVEPEFTVPAGRHHILVTTPGYRPVQRSIKLSRYITLKIGMALALRGGLESTIMKVADEGATSELSNLTIKRMASQLDVEGILLVHAHKNGGKRRGFIWWQGTNGRASPAIERARLEGLLINWSVAMLKELAERREREVVPFFAGWDARVRGGPVYARRRRKLSGFGRTGFNARFDGAGGLIQADAHRFGLFTEADFGYTNYGFSRSAVDLDDGTIGTAGGGWEMFTRAGIGNRTELGPKDVDRRSWVQATVGAFWEHHDADDVDDGAGPIGLFTSHQSFGIDVRGSVHWVVPGRVPYKPVVSVGAGIIPWSKWREQPAVTGTSPRAFPGATWMIATEGTVKERWRVGLRYEGSFRTVGFNGTAAAPVFPPISAAIIEETEHVFTLQAARNF